MKILKHILSAAALLLLAAACSHDPEEIVVSSADPVIASHGEVTVNNLTAEETFTLVWSPAKFGQAVGVEYTVSAKCAGEYVELGSTDACFFSTTNARLFEAVGIALTGSYDVIFSVEALSDAGAVRSARPLVVHFVYDKKTYLHLIGSYSNWATGTGGMSRVLQDEDGIFRGFVYFPVAGEFKFASQPDWNGTNYGAGEDGALSTDGEAVNLTAAAGLYYAEVDIDALTYAFDPVAVSVAVGDKQEPMVYNAADKSWIAIADVDEGAAYTLKFEGADGLTLGGDEKNLSVGGDALSTPAGGIVSFKLSIFDYPYSVAVGEVEEDSKKLYVAHSVNDWNYFEAPVLSQLEADKFYGLINFIGATSPEILLARLQSPLGTQFGGSASALVTYAGGDETTPIAAAAGLRFYAVDLSDEETKVLYDTEITDAAVVLAGEPATSLPMTADGEGKWTLTHTFDAVGKFSIALNGGKIECGGTEYPAVLGGSCTGLVLDGGALNMTKGEHELVLDLTGAAMTLSIDGEIADLQLYPETIGVTGSYQGWAPADAPQLWGNVETGSYWGYVSMFAEGGVEFKFTYGDTWVAGQAVEGSETEFVLGVGDNMMIAEGLYRWDVSLDAMTAKATPLTKVGLIGDGVGSWDNDVELVRDSEDGLYKASGVATVKGEFKIRFNGAWDYSLGGVADKLVDNGGNIAIEAGTFDFALDLTHTPYKISVTAAQ